ncbi:MAG: polymer-forming cytoskeletal protein [Steroidobacteraceae bacterium]
MALWNEKPTAAPAPARKEPLTPAPAGPAVQPAATPVAERNLAERSTSEAALAAASRRPTPRERSEGGESVIAANLSIEGKIEGSGNVRMAGRFKGDVRIDGNFSIDHGAHLTGQVLAAIVVVGGELQGNIESAKRVDVLEGGIIVGDVKAGSITVAAGSRMRGHVEFGWEEEKAVKISGSAVGGS